MKNEVVQDGSTPAEEPGKGNEAQAQSTQSDLAQRIRAIGWDPDRFEEQAKAAIREMNAKQREVAQLRKVADRATKWGDLIDVLESSPDIALTVLDTVRDAIVPSDYNGGYQVADDPREGTEQAQHAGSSETVDRNEIEELKAAVQATRAALTLDSELAQLSKELGMEISPEQKVKVLERIEKSGGKGSVKEHFLAEFGMDLIRSVKGESESQSASAQDASAFPRSVNTDGASSSGGDSGVDASNLWSLPRRQRESVLVQEIAKRLKST